MRDRREPFVPPPAQSDYIGRGHLNRSLLEGLLEEVGCEALILWSERAILHAAGAHPGNVTRFDRPGGAFLVVPKDPHEPPCAVIGDYYSEMFIRSTGITDVRSFEIWVDTADVTGPDGIGALRTASPDRNRPRPETFSAKKSAALLSDALSDHGLLSCPLAVEGLGGLGDGVFETLGVQPGTVLTSADPILARARARKSATERRLLRDAASYAQAGLEYALKFVHDGVSQGDLAAAYREGTLRAAEGFYSPSRVSCWSSIAIGPAARPDDRRLVAGDIVKFDVGVVIDGYSSDSARTFAFGRPSSECMELYSVLLSAYETALEKIVVGEPLMVPYEAGRRRMHSEGFKAFRRGHIGHGLGASRFTEEWPFISATSDYRLHSDNVVAVEMPWYINGIGALMVEDQFECHDGVFQPSWTLPRHLVEL